MTTPRSSGWMNTSPALTTVRTNSCDPHDYNRGREIAPILWRREERTYGKSNQSHKRQP